MPLRLPSLVCTSPLSENDCTCASTVTPPDWATIVGPTTNNCVPGAEVCPVPSDSTRLTVRQPGAVKNLCTLGPVAVVPSGNVQSHDTVLSLSSVDGSLPNGQCVSLQCTEILGTGATSATEIVFV